MILIDSLTKRYSKNEIGLNNLSFDIPNKGLTIIVGESGSGKTTLLNLLSGLLKPTSGSIVVDGVDLTKLSDREIARYRGKNIGFIFQDYKLIERWTVGKNISYACELAGIKITKKEIEDICVSLELIDDSGKSLVNKKVANLSGGQKQRVAIARAIIKKPKILLCDEPTGALDKENSIQVVQKLRTISENIPVILVTHDESIINKNDYVVKLSKGEIFEIHNKPIIESRDEPKSFKAENKMNPFVVFKTAMNCLFSKKIMVAFSMILCGLSLFAFSLPLIGKSASRNYQNIQIDTLSSHKQQYAILSSDNILVSYDDDKYNYHYSGFSDQQVETIEQYNGFSYVGYDNGTRVYGLTVPRERYISSDDYKNAYEKKCLTTFANEIHFKDTSHIETIGYVKDERVTVENRFPSTANEFAITDFQADLLLEYGFTEWDSNTHEPSLNKTSFTSIDDLIGFEINGYTICGVVKSPASKEIFDTVGKKNGNETEIDKVANEYHFLNETVWIAAEGETRTGQTLVRLDKGASALKKLLNDLHFVDYDHLNTKHKHNVALATPYDESINLAIGVLDNKITRTVLMIVSGVFCAIVFILNLFTLSGIFALKKKELGVICCLGGSKSFNVCVCLIEALLIAIGSALVTFAASLIYVLSVNSQWNVMALMLMPLDALLVLGICLVLVLASSIHSLLKVSRSEIVDLVKEQE